MPYAPCSILCSPPIYGTSYNDIVSFYRISHPAEGIAASTGYTFERRRKHRHEHERGFAMSTLVAYFSATGSSGTTAHVAKNLAQATGADLFEIAPETPYTEADLDWHDASSRSSVEMRDETCRPAIAGAVDGMDAYDTVFVGFPIWWYVEPRIIDTFLESYDFAGKTVVPFATSGGSNLGKAPERMEGIAKGATVLAGKMLNGNPGVDELRAWAESIGR